MFQPQLDTLNYYRDVAHWLFVYLRQLQQIKTNNQSIENRVTIAWLPKTTASQREYLELGLVHESSSYPSKAFAGWTYGHDVKIVHVVQHPLRSIESLMRQRHSAEDEFWRALAPSLNWKSKDLERMGRFVRCTR